MVTDLIPSLPIPARTSIHCPHRKPIYPWWFDWCRPLVHRGTCWRPCYRRWNLTGTLCRCPWPRCPLTEATDSLNMSPALPHAETLPLPHCRDITHTQLFSLKHLIETTAVTGLLGCFSGNQSVCTLFCLFHSVISKIIKHKMLIVHFWEEYPCVFSPLGEVKCSHFWVQWGQIIQVNVCWS